MFPANYVRDRQVMGSSCHAHSTSPTASLALRFLGLCQTRSLTPVNRFPLKSIEIMFQWRPFPSPHAPWRGSLSFLAAGPLNRYAARHWGGAAAPASWLLSIPFPQPCLAVDDSCVAYWQKSVQQNLCEHAGLLWTPSHFEWLFRLSQFGPAESTLLGLEAVGRFEPSLGWRVSVRATRYKAGQEIVYILESHRLKAGVKRRFSPFLL